jgi:hypothetical protein
MPNNRKPKSSSAPATDPKNAPIAPGAPVAVAAPDFKTIYTNFVNAAFSPLDIFFTLGEAIGPGPDGRPVILQRAKIIMSPKEAKIVAAILMKAVADYEKKFGKIVVERELLTPTA